MNTFGKVMLLLALLCIHIICAMMTSARIAKLPKNNSF